MKVGSLPFTDYVPHASETDGLIHIDHENCPAGRDTKKRLYIRTEGSIILGYCHNCGLGGRYFKRNVPKSIWELRRELSSLPGVSGSPPAEIVVGSDSVIYPVDAELDPSKWPVRAAAWLYKYRFTDAQIVHWQLGYSPSLRRVILPVFSKHDSRLVLYQARAVFEGQQPKYLTFSSSSKSKAAWYVDTTKDHIVVVEDILSGIRVAEVANCVALLGTKLDDATKAELLQYKKVSIFMDDDIPGRVAARTIGTELRPHTKVHRITSAAQPKELSRDDLDALINGSGPASPSSH